MFLCLFIYFFISLCRSFLIRSLSVFHFLFAYLLFLPFFLPFKRSVFVTVFLSFFCCVCIWCYGAEQGKRNGMTREAFCQVHSSSDLAVAQNSTRANRFWSIPLPDRATSVPGIPILTDPHHATPTDRLPISPSFFGWPISHPSHLLCYFSVCFTFISGWLFFFLFCLVCQVFFLGCHFPSSSAPDGSSFRTSRFGSRRVDRHTLEARSGHRCSGGKLPVADVVASSFPFFFFWLFVFQRNR